MSETQACIRTRPADPNLGSGARARTLLLWIAVFPGLAATSGPVFAEEAQGAPEVLRVGGEEFEVLSPEEVQAAGFPWSDVPPEENAATWYLRGADALLPTESDEIADAQREHVIQYVWDDGLEELAEEIREGKEALGLYRRGAACRRCQLPYTTSDEGFIVGHADLWMPARSAAALLAAEARRFEARGQYDKAIENYTSLLRIGAHHGNGGLLIDLLVGFAVLSAGGEAIVHGIYRRDYPPAELHGLLREIDGLEKSLPSLTHVLRGEKAFAMRMIDKIMESSPEMVRAAGGLGPSSGDVRPRSLLEKRLLRIVLPDRTVKKDLARMFDRKQEAASRPFYERRVGGEEVLRECKPWNVLAGLLGPSMTMGGTQALKGRARWDLLRLAVALRVHHADMGAYPERLEDLLKTGLLARLPVDPFSGKPYRYRVDAGEFAVWSAGDGSGDERDDVEPADEESRLELGFRSKLPDLEPFEREDEVSE